MKMDDLHAVDDEDLRERLSHVDITVPSIGNGRVTDHTEIWVVCRLLSTLAKAGKLSYPLYLHKRERPDFLLTCADNKIGIEITEAVPEHAARYFALIEKKFPEITVFEIPDFVFDGSRTTTKDMCRCIQQNKDSLQGSAWLGDEPERKWAELVHGVIDHKLVKLQKDGFERLPRNWLAIYDNLPLPGINLQNAIDCLLPRICEKWSNMPCFDAVFIEHGSSIVQITADSAEHMALDDLWEGQ